MAHGGGAAHLLAGSIMFIYAALHPTHPTAACPATGCSGSNGEQLNVYLVLPAGMLVGLGGALLLAGVPIYVVGEVRMRRAELTWAPQLGPQSVSLGARLRF